MTYVARAFGSLERAKSRRSSCSMAIVLLVSSLRVWKPDLVSSEVWSSCAALSAVCCSFFRNPDGRGVRRSCDQVLSSLPSLAAMRSCSLTRSIRFWKSSRRFSVVLVSSPIDGLRRNSSSSSSYAVPG